MIHRFELLQKPDTNQLIGNYKDCLHLEYFRVSPVREASPARPLPADRPIQHAEPLTELGKKPLQLSVP